MLERDDIAQVLTMCRMLALALCVVVSVGAAAQSGWAVAITTPADGETVHDNEGNLRVALAIEGAGETPKTRLLLDGSPYGPDQCAPSFTLNNIDRGQHTLQAQLIDSEGRVIAVSQSVIVHLWRASALFPSRKK